MCYFKVKTLKLPINVIILFLERPLLVYTCKIDLRQWFLVTNMSPVVVWMYKLVLIQIYNLYICSLRKSYSME